MQGNFIRLNSDYVDSATQLHRGGQMSEKIRSRVGTVGGCPHMRGPGLESRGPSDCCKSSERSEPQFSRRTSPLFGDGSMSHYFQMSVIGFASRSLAVSGSSPKLSSIVRNTL